MNKTISVLGCGWLGLPLAKALSKSGYIIKGSTTSEEKLDTINQFVNEAFVIKVEEQRIFGNIDAFLSDVDILILNIPPQLRKNSTSNYVSKITHVLNEVVKHKVKHVLYVSSTSVFPDDNKEYQEDDHPVPHDYASEQLIQAELLIKNATNFNSTIVRFGGLIGENRHPVTFLAQSKEVQNANAPINLIHLEDCIGIIKKIIDTQKWGHIFHGVAPFHPSKKEYYTKVATEKGLQLSFQNDECFSGKIIQASKTITTLGYIFQKSSL